MFIGILTLLVALILSGVAAWYSIIGLVAIFSAAAFHVAIMGAVLEGSKLLLASWLYRYWGKSPKLLKIYLTSALIILAFITSLGIFGFLSKAHLDASHGASTIETQLRNLQSQKQYREAEVVRLNESRTQLDNSLNQLYTRGLAKTGSAEFRRQEAARKRIEERIQVLQTEMLNLDVESNKVAEQLTTVELKVGPIRYVAEMIFGESDKTVLEKSVRYLIILIVSVFDPLAILLVIAANIAIDDARQSKQSKSAREPESTTEKENGSKDIPTTETPNRSETTVPERRSKKERNQKSSRSRTKLQAKESTAMGTEEGFSGTEETVVDIDKQDKTTLRKIKIQEA